MLFTLIVYQPNGADSCRGYVRRSFDSSLEIWSGNDENALIELWATHLDKNQDLKDGQAAYEVTLLIEGMAPYASDVQEFCREDARREVWTHQEMLEPEFDRLRALVNERLLELNAQRLTAANTLPLANPTAQEVAERAELTRLLQKYGSAK